MKPAVLALLLLASPLPAAERVALSLPARISFGEAAPFAETPRVVAALATFNRARLGDGRRLRISVRSEPLGAGGHDLGRARLTFRSREVHGGSGFSGVLLEGAYQTVFEGLPGADHGSFEVEWSLERPASRRAGRYSLALRWRVEAVGPLTGSTVP